MDLLPDLLDSEERRLLRRTVAGLLADRLPDATALELDRTGTFDEGTWQALGAAGLLGLGVPEAAGGSGGTVTDSAIVTVEIARRLPSLAVDYVLCGMTARSLVEHGTEAQRDWLAGMTAGSRLIAYGLSEPGGGTDLLQLTTSAVEDTGGSWVLNGAKQWISLAGHADTILVLARTDPPPPGRSRAHGLSLIAVPREQAGVTTRRIRLEGMRAAGSYDVFLDDAVAPPGSLLGERGRGFFQLRATLDIERILSAAISVGIATTALELTVRHATARTAFGGPIGRFQSIQHPAADSLTELTGAALLLDRACGAVAAGAPDSSRLSAMAKLSAAETATRITDRGMRAWGAMGLSAEGRMQLMFRDSRLALFSPISNDMIRNMLGESLGLPRSY